MSDSTDEVSELKTRTLQDIEGEIEERFADEYSESVFSKGPIELLIYGLSTAFFLYHLWYGYTAEIPRQQHGIIHLALVLVLWALFKLVAVDRSTVRGKLLTAGYAVYAVLSVVPLYYMTANYDDIVQTAGVYSDFEMMMGALLIGLVLIALMTISRLITGVALLGLVYSFFGQQMPGILNHRGLSLERIITMNTLEMQGLLGTLLQISATWVVIFLILAGIMEKYGGMATFVKGMTRYAARSKYLEIGQVAVAASMFMGSINGSTAANTATTGAFTIPLMKENGYKPKLAASVEAVASCGGQVLPPIMGAGAFLMAELIDMSYSDIIVGAAAPAVLFFLAVGISISLSSQKTLSQNIQTEPDERSVFGKFADVFRHYEYIGMFVVLLYYLVIVQADPMLAGFWAILTMIGLRFVRTLEEAYTGDIETVSALKGFGRETLEGFSRGAEVTLDITILLASLGIVIRALIVTGFAQRLSTYLVIIAGGVFITMLFLTMAASIAFGMGMSTTAAYMIVAILVAPALTGDPINLNEFSAHMFVFYFAIVSNITPPIALSVIIAQGIAGSEFWETAIQSLKIGNPMFLLPFAFVANAPLLHVGPMTPVMFVVVLLGFIALAISMTGQIRGSIGYPTRVGFLLLGLLAMFAPMLMAQIGIAIAIAVAATYFAEPEWMPVGRATS